MVLALEGLRVVDVSQGIPGPACAMQLADLGAETVKLEPPTGDWLRDIGPFHEPGGESELFLQLNRNKRGIAVDLKTPQGKEVLSRLLEGADILVEGYRPGVMQRLGFDYETLQDRHPRLIYCSISGYGSGGPLATAPATEIDVQARAGLNRHMGGPDKPPVRFGLDLASMGAAMAGVQGVLAALLWRRRSGEGQYVQTSMLAAQVSLVQWDLTSEESRQSGVLTSPPDIGFQTADGPALVQLRGLEGWHSLIKALGRDELLNDPRFSRPGLNAPTLAAELRPQLEKLSFEEARRLIEDGLSGTIVRMNDFAQLLREPQIDALGSIRTLSGHRTAGDYQTLDVPWTFVDEPVASLRRPAPVVGEHTREVLLELGYPVQTIDELEAAGAVKSWQGGG